ncbi:MAG: type I glyceraldehyde-3-phosphate dehydrogenase [Rickettsiales bacterium]
MIKIAINGFGRIGKCVLRSYFARKPEGVEIVAINAGFGNLPMDYHLFKYDSTHGIFPGVKLIEGRGIEIDGQFIPITYEPDATKLGWGNIGVDIVLECSGAFTKRDLAAKHLSAGAKKVMVSAPCDGADATIVHRVNNQVLTADLEVISIGSCTTNCLAPVAKVLNDTFGIESGFMTTIHAYTNDQNLLDANHKDLRRARAAAVSMIPSSTGAAKALGLVLPELNGKLDGVAIRVPTPNVSLVDLKFTASKNTTVQEINAAIKSAASGVMQGVLAIEEEELVSVDFKGNPHSSIVDATQTKVVNGNFVRVASWYDNEWGFSNRMIDVAIEWGNKLK